MDSYLGDFTFESKERASSFSDPKLKVYGVDRSDGLTPVAKYTSKDLGRYKVLKTEMFAYNPMRLNIGSIAYCDANVPSGLVSPDYVVFGCRPEKLDPKFLSYYIKGPIWKRWATAAGVGSVRTRIYFRELARMPVVFPPLPEQKAIAAVLGTLEDKIELNRRTNATLDAIARALFQSWFVDFDPVRAKLDDRQPAGLDPATAAFFPNEFEDSELGSIPKGWEVGQLSDSFDLTMGQSPPGETYNEDGRGLPFYQGRADFGFRFPARRVFCTAPTRYAKPGDTLVSVRAPVGDINMADEECCIGRGVAAVRHKSGASSFTYYAMENFESDFARFEADGTVFGSINKQNFAELVATYESLAAPFDGQIGVAEQQSRIIASLRDALLPRLLSGKLRLT
jgi:type I restriction enzyme, S subunit